MEKERQDIFEKATEDLFENIYEIDITHNLPANPATEAYFESLGAPSSCPFDQALRIIAQKTDQRGIPKGIHRNLLAGTRPAGLCGGY